MTLCYAHFNYNQNNQLSSQLYSYCIDRSVVDLTDYEMSLL